MRRVVSALLLAALVPLVLLRDGPQADNRSQEITATLLFSGAGKRVPRVAGPFTIEAVWQLTSSNVRFSGYSGLVVDRGKLLAVSDRGTYLVVGLPLKPGMQPARMAHLPLSGLTRSGGSDSEALAVDPGTGMLWIAFEDVNAVERFSPGFSRSTAARKVAALHHWPSNRGAEAMTRLHDGRFVFLGEQARGDGRHPGVLLQRDPAGDPKSVTFEFAGSGGFRPTDLAELPDGRVLVLSRSLLWPMPPRFAAKLSLADPAEIAPCKPWSSAELAVLPDELPLDNMEGLAIEPEPRADGSLNVWLISDDNNALTQRTVLWQLRLYTAALPPVHKQKTGPQARFR